MIQNIEPKQFNNLFREKKASPQDVFLAYKDDAVLVKEGRESLWYPAFSDFAEQYPDLAADATFLFTIDDSHFYLVQVDGLDQVEGWTYTPASRFRTDERHWRSFAGAVGMQLDRWYRNHRCCGRCGSPLDHAVEERRLSCSHCGHQVYPALAPCVIVGVHDGDRLLLTKYAGRSHKNYALVAGFVEVGETLEQAVRREVMEEVGLAVKHITYYKSQPWPFTDTLLAGFFAELEGEDAIRLQEDELALGVWMDRQDIPPRESEISLTSEMMEAFRTGAWHK